MFYLRSSLWSLDLLLFHFRGLFSSLSVATAILDSFSLFYLPNMLKLKLQYFGNLMQRADSLEKTLMLGKFEGRRRGGRQRMR